MTRENLYTSGGEFLLPNGEVYVGNYHVHVTGGAMVGRSHVSTPHDRLTPLTDQARALVESLQDQLRQRQNQASSPITSSVSRSSSGGGGGGGSAPSGGGSSPAPSY